MFPSTSLSIIVINFISGIVFGWTYIFSKKILFQLKKSHLHAILSALRVITFSIFFYFMLKSTQISPIILVTAFLAGYWAIIIKYKENSHG